MRIRSKGRHGAPAGSRPRESEDPLLAWSVQAVIEAAGGQRGDGTVRGRPRDFAVAVIRAVGGEVARLRAQVRELEARGPQPAGGPAAFPAMTIARARETSVALVAAARRTLDEHQAPNYVEQEVADPQTGDRYLVIYVRPGGRTPSQMQADAEDRARRAEARIAELERAPQRDAPATTDDIPGYQPAAPAPKGD